MEQATLPAPAATSVYRLTGKGMELERPLVELCRWGLRHGVAPVADSAHDPRWTVLAMRAAFARARARGIVANCEFRVDDTVFHARIQDGELSTALGPADDPDFVLSLDDGAFRELTGGVTGIDALLAANRASIVGDSGHYQRFAEAFAP